MNLNGHSNLARIAQATGAVSLFLGVGKGRQQRRGQINDDGDDHQQFDECEGMLPLRRVFSGFNLFHKTSPLREGCFFTAKNRRAPG
jgi:hypothetical protein